MELYQKIEVYKKLLQMFLLSKIHCDNNDGRLFKEGTLESLISIGPLVNKDEKTKIAYFKQITADDTIPYNLIGIKQK
jgi:hypothetical protein